MHSHDVDTLLAAATTEVVVMSSLSPGRTDPISTFRLPGQVRPGVRCRILVPDTARVTALLAGAWRLRPRYVPCHTCRPTRS
ncbi:hypothetical protein KIPE111705_07315 [Kibdelosporangium persicum]|uniref:hypothetical protein n=1 Tax=Kibdelosporangium persicum TaxID=2698649 RepID=UPI001FE89389|nr:hypothetical protein [Kibdelosporangium persicum]